MRNYAKVLHKIFKQHMFWIFVRIASTKYPKHMFSSESDSTKYSKHMFYEEIRIKQGLSNISFCPLRNLYNSKFIIMTTFLGTNAVVVTGVHCKSFWLALNQ